MGPVERPSVVEDEAASSSPFRWIYLAWPPALFMPFRARAPPKRLFNLPPRLFSVRLLRCPHGFGISAGEALDTAARQIDKAIDRMQCDPGVLQCSRTRQVQGQCPPRGHRSVVLR